MKVLNTSTDPSMKLIAFGRGRLVVACGVEYQQREFSGMWLVVRRGATVRTWGTSNGVAELCVLGPLPSTTLDAIPVEQGIPLGSVHDILAIRDDAATKFLSEIDAAELKLLKGK